MKETDLHVFIEAATEFFDINLGKGQLRVGQPVLMPADQVRYYEYTGVIDISGDVVGRVYFSAPLSLIQRLLENMGEKVIDDELIADLVGEIANSIAGNARACFGSGFCLSTPQIFHENALAKLPVRSSQAYVVPLSWNESASSVAIWFD